MNAKVYDGAVRALYVSLGVATAVLAFRTLLGTTSLGNWIGQKSPLGPESLFSVSWLCLILLCAGYNGAGPSAVRSSNLWVLAALLCIGLVFAFNLNSPFLSDDYVLVRAPMPSIARLSANLRTAGGDGGFRPLGNLYFSVAHQWAGFDPLRWHVLGLALHLLNCLALYLVVWLLWRDTFLAISSTLLFGLHGTRPEVVSWTAGSFDLLAAFLVLASLAVFFGPIRVVFSWPLALVLMIGAVLSKESAYAYPPLLLGLAYAAGRANRRTCQFAVLATLVCGGLFAYRWWLFGGPGGYIDQISGRPQILSLHIIPTAKALLARIWVILLFPINWEASMGTTARLAIPIGCVAFAGLAAGAKSASRRTVFVLVGAVLLSVIPAVHLALIGSSCLGSRILYLPAAAFAPLIGILARPLRYRNVLLSALAFFAVVTTFHNLSAWRDAALLADRVCTQAAGSADRGRGFNAPSTRDGVYFIANGFQACIETKIEMRRR